MKTTMIDSQLSYDRPRANEAALGFDSLSDETSYHKGFLRNLETARFGES